MRANDHPDLPLQAVDAVEIPLKVPPSLARRTDLSAAAKLIYAVIADRIGSNGECWPGVRKLGEDIGEPKSVACRCVQELERLGLIAVVHVSGNPAHQTNRYRLCVPPEGRRAGGTYRQRDRDVPPAGQNPTKRTPPKKEEKSAGDPWALALGAMTTTILQTEAFRAAWGDWITYRQEARKPLTASTIRAQIKKLEGFGHDRAIESIRNSISNGWQGLFEPGGRAGGAAGGVARVAARPGKYRGREFKLPVVPDAAPDAGAGSKATAPARVASA